MRHTFRLPEPGSPEITVDNSQIAGLRVSIDGQRAPRLRERGRPAWLVPMADGSTRRVSFAGAFTGLRAVVDDGPTIELERPLALWELVLTVLPFGLLGLTGVAGGVLGLIAIVANLQVMRLPWPAAARALGALGSLAIAFVASYAISVLLFA
jgi:hypothetical protein